MVATYFYPHRRRIRCRLKTWATTIKTDLEPPFYARWKKDWVKASSEPAKDSRAWSTSVNDVVNSVGDAGSTRPGGKSIQVKQVGKSW